MCLVRVPCRFAVSVGIAAVTRKSEEGNADDTANEIRSGGAADTGTVPKG